MRQQMKMIYMLRKPAHLKALVQHWQGGVGPIASHQEHLRAAMDWLCRAQDISTSGGVSAGYSLIKGWKPPFPETTGYIIPTFLTYADWVGQEEFRRRALAMGDWEISIQLPSGAVRGGVGINDQPLVFDTGQVILGWTALYRETQSDRFLEAAVRAADWLLSIQDDDGGWTGHTFRGLSRVYHTRVVWPLLEVYQLTEDQRYRRSAEKQLCWTLDRTTGSGWFHHMGFSENALPPTHTIAYTLRGLLESGHILGDEEMIMRVVGVAQRIIDIHHLADARLEQAQPAFLPATLDADWTSADRYSCLTGNVQLAILWLHLFQKQGTPAFRIAAHRLIDGVKATQSLRSRNDGILGAVPGSKPLWGGYLPYTYPNWATKFLADALLLRLNMERPSGGGV
jgi:hypothetical protein